MVNSSKRMIPISANFNKCLKKFHFYPIYERIICEIEATLLPEKLYTEKKHSKINISLTKHRIQKFNIDLYQK